MWKVIQGFEDYEVSDEGEVRSSKGGKQRVLKTNIHKGYYYVSLWKDNKGYNKTIARLVALAFIPNPENLLDVDHKDCNKLNNRVDNLRWCSRSQNICNQNKRSNNTSGYKGVVFRKDRNKWTARITLNYKTINLGFFSTPEEAYQAYCKSALELNGDFHRI